MANKVVIAVASAIIILMFQNCAKNPNIGAYSQSASSLGATCLVTPAQIVGTLQNQTVTAGQPINVVVATSGDNVQYSWSKNGTVINDTTNTLAIASAAAADAGTYSVTVANSCNSMSASFTVAVSPAVSTVTLPVITSPPANVAGVYNVNADVYLVPADTTAPFNLVKFGVTATGANLSYQWYYVNSAGTATAIAGATQATYSFALNSTTQAGTYRVVVANSAGPVQAQAALTVAIRDIIKLPPGGGPIP